MHYVGIVWVELFVRKSAWLYSLCQVLVLVLCPLGFLLCSMHDCKQVFSFSVTGEWYVVALPCLILRKFIVATYNCIQPLILACMHTMQECVYMHAPLGCTLASCHAFVTIKPSINVPILTCSDQKSLAWSQWNHPFCLYCRSSASGAQ